MAEDGLEVQPKPRKRKEKPNKPKAEEIPLHDQTSTKLRVDELLQQVVAQSTKDAVTEAKKKKKKKTKDADADDAVLESLRKGKGIEGLHKEADTALLNNIYEPDDSPKNEKSNKQRQRKQQSGTGLKPLKDNLEIAEAEKIKAKKKKKKDAVETEVTPEPSLELSESKTEEKEAAPVPRERKKKKKKPAEDAQSPREEDTASPEPETPVSSARAVKKKMKKLVEQLDTQSPASEDGLTETETPVTSPRRRKKKKTEDTEPDIPEEAEAPPAEPVASPKEEKKKKKKKKEEKTDDEDVGTEEKKEEEEGVAEAKKKKKGKKDGEEDGSKDKKKKKGKKEDEEAGVDEEAAESAAAETQEESVETKKGKKKKKKKGEEVEVGAGEGPAAVEDEEERVVAEAPDDGEVLAVMVHRTDKLKNDFNILHPVVRVHIVDESTGQYLPKQHKDRAVSSYYEMHNENMEQVLPIMTQPFDFKQKRSTIPMWEELMVFNENFNYFIQSSPKALMLFELRDFVSMNSTNNKSETGWHRIAWAFLKIVGGNGKINVGSKLRLQLFQIPSRRFPKGGQPEVYNWWKSQQRSPYPSTLYVTLKSIVPPDNVEPSLRSMFATQQEQGAMTYEDLKRSMNWDSKAHKLEARPLTSWSRLFGQLCRIPNSLILTLPARKKGCFVIKFSHDGRSLACACGSSDGYPILIYEVPSGDLKMELHGHFSLVYDLSWSRKDTHLMSASADGTVRTWNIVEEKGTAEKVLPHPGFVYCCEYHPRLDSIAVSGCYDQVLRVWDLSQPEGGQLMQEIEDHHGYINSICFDDDEGQKMYSADSVGVVNIWNVYVTDEPDRRPFVRDWTLYHSLQEPELKDVQINHIEMHPSGRRLLVHCRDNVIRMFDLRVQRVMQQYIGGVNFREKLGSCMTPCGTFIFAGSEDNFVYAWNTDTGDQVARYTELNYVRPVTDVAYHPRDHILAVCSLGENQPIFVYKYDPFTAQVDAGLASPRAPDEETDIEALAGTSTSPMKEEELQLARSKVLSKEEFQAQEKQRYSRIMKKLDAATLQMSQMPGMVTMDTTRRMDTIGRQGVTASWSNTDTGSYIATPRSTMLSPGALSPHATPTMLSTIQQQQFASQNLYMKQADSSWRPTFSEVGRHGTKSTHFGRPPQIALDNSQGKAQFSFQAPLGSTRKPKKVVALYDYKAQRSDELSLFCGDSILLLHKDSENWWMGELPDGQQGFFPANYVTMAEDDDDEEAAGKKHFTAIKTKDGQLRFLSGGEESDSDMNETNSDLQQSKTTNGKKKRVHYDD
ncbi:jouberin-like [Babylonia areolata]|uniref:jouberin-like n=1 Tax=Babylonia areolata TaxID=304850 RepID=UPI003FD030C3